MGGGAARPREPCLEVRCSRVHPVLAMRGRGARVDAEGAQGDELRLVGIRFRVRVRVRFRVRVRVTVRVRARARVRVRARARARARVSAMSRALRMRRLARMERETSASMARYMTTIGTIETTDCIESCTETAA